ncbi:MAG: methyltransferase domain-containing protein, partial [Nakamurella sp.]
MPTEEFRRELMTSLGDLGTGIGLEIGPLNRPVARKSHCNVRYVDVFDAPTIRHHYRDDPNVNVADIPDLDFCLHTADGSIQSLIEATGSDAPYTWVLASHVIEHVPDLIGWLSQVAAVLQDGGTLVLAIPDQRYTFDVLRPATTVGQILQAHHSQDTIPSIRAVFDHFRSVVNVSAADLWAGRKATVADRVYDLPGTLNQLSLARDQGKYVDSHVWMFTPLSFVEQLAELGRLELIDFSVEQVVPTTPGELEFYAALTRLPRGASDQEAAAFRARSIEHLAGLTDAPAAEPVDRAAEPDDQAA